WARKRIISSLINEAITSSQIEGAAVTRRKAKELIRSGNKPKNRDEKMIINNYLTIHRIKSEFYKEEASDELLSQIHIQLTEDTLKAEDVGRFREDVDDQDIVCVYDDDGKVLHEPPNAEMLPKYLADLYQFMNDEREFVHPVLKAIIIHFAIGYIHPYYDGNGRLARALFYWYLIKKGYRLFEFISISEQIKNSVGQYKRAYLYTEIDDNDLTYFINYQLKVINICIKDLKIYINKQVKELKRIKESLKDIPGINIRQLDLLNHALKHPDYRYTIKDHQTSNGISWATARTDLMSLAQKMLLDQKKLGKELHFFIPKNLADKIQNISSL
ncbi:MAG: Fic family protein, partial [bacterium]|nr:Fic family protein [bacterium]